ncbi:MAG: hypothetical protein JW963_17830 [Anaerolineales bacterium]|nr:hypothetical protein [Anaerolineales bacterium]
MIRKLSFALLAVMLMATFAVPVLAQYNFAMDVGINLANLDPNNEANIVVSYYPMGTGTSTDIPDTIAAGGAAKYYPIPVGSGFNGSAVVSSDRPIAAIVNEISSAYGGSYNGFSSGSTDVAAPIVMRNNGGYSTEISIQNTGSSTADVDVVFSAGNYGNDYTMPTFQIEPNRVYRIYQGDQADLGTRFVGSAQISSGEPLAVVVNQINNTNRTLLVYSAAAQGFTTIAVPQVQNNNGGYDTGIQVQNVDATRPATITVTYGPNAAPGGTAFTPGVQTATNVQPGDTAIFNQWGNVYGYNWDTASRYVGAAVVSTDEGDIPLVVNVNILKLATPAQAAAYEGMNGDSTSTSFAAPILMSNNGGFSTSCLVLNPSDSASVDVTMSFTPNTAAGITFQPVDEFFTLDAGESNQFRQFPTLGQWAADNGGARWLGAGEINATGPIAVVCNQLNFNATSSDGLMSYIAVPLD